MSKMLENINGVESREEKLIPISPPTTSMRNDIERGDTQISQNFSPKCHRTHHTSWRGGANRR
jgi:hypothetical protein